MNLKEDSFFSEYGSLGLFIKQKFKTSSCHFLKIYMKISLNARRTSPPLNMAQILGFFLSNKHVQLLYDNCLKYEDIAEH